MKENIKSLSFGTKEDAINFMASKDCLAQSSRDPSVFWRSDTYYLSHGEYSRPEYRVTRYGKDWGIEVVYHYYSGTLYTPENGRLEYDVWDDN